MANAADGVSGRALRRFECLAAVFTDLLGLEEAGQAHAPGINGSSMAMGARGSRSPSGTRSQPSACCGVSRESGC
jgi:hypothetical protein